MEIFSATNDDARLIHDLAEQIWWPTYQPILSDEQISFMLEHMYSPEALLDQMQNGVIFLLAKREEKIVAFAGYTIHQDTEALLKIHKLYVLPTEQGKGTGRTLIDHLGTVAHENNLKFLELNVNRSNPALGFYQKNGFSIKETVDIPYHQFVLNDYVMRKAL